MAMPRTKTATGAGTVATAALVLLFGNQIVTEWITNHATSNNAANLLLRQLTWPSWAVSTESGESARNLMARDLRAALVVAFAALILGQATKSSQKGFLVGWAALVFSSALAAFGTAFLESGATLTRALQEAGGASAYGLFVGWIVGIITGLAKRGSST